MKNFIHTLREESGAETRIYLTQAVINVTRREITKTGVDRELQWFDFHLLHSVLA